MLSHLKILDLTDGLGAYTGRLLAELGADVLKIESPEGDAARKLGPAIADDAGLPWLVWNAGKRGTVLDLQRDADRETFLELVIAADVLVRGSAVEPFDHDALAIRNPRLIDVVIAPFNLNSKLLDRPAVDLTLMARSGLTAIGGDPDRAPLRLPGEQAYALAGIQGAIAALTALHARNASGKGQLVCVSGYQSAVLANYREPLTWEWTGRVGTRTGNLLVRGKSGVRQVWPCQDGYVTWTLVDNPGMMRALVAVVAEAGTAGMLGDIDWDATLVADVPRETLIQWEACVETFFRGHTKAELAQLSVQRGFGLSKIDELDDVLDSAHLRHRSLWRTVVDQMRGLTLRLPGPLFASSEQTAPIVRTAPALSDGLSTRAACGDANVSDSND